MKRIKLNKFFAAIIFCLTTLFFSQNGLAQLNAAFTGPVTSCLGNAASFADQSTGGPIAWFWDFPGGSPAFSVQQNPIVNYYVPGTYNVQLVVYDGTVYDTSLMFNFITVDGLQVVWTSQNPTCGMNNGTIALSVVGGFPPYIFIF